MLQYILKRLFAIFLSLLGVSIIVFSMVHLMGDPIIVILGERKSNPELINEVTERFGLNRPLVVQYLVFLWNIAQFDFGRSFKTNELVSRDIISHFPATCELTIAAMIFAIIVGIAAGVIAATRRGSVFDYVSMVGSLTGVSMPIFWLGMTLIIVFASWLGILPVSSRIGDMIFPPLPKKTGFHILDSIISGRFDALIDSIRHLILPAITLGTVPLAIIARMTRSSLMEVMHQDYVRTARAKGLSEKIVVLKHALKNAIIPVITVIGLEFGYLLGGAVLTESIFAWPGLGRWLFMAFGNKDIMQIQGGVLFVAVLFMMVNLFVDISYAYFDPRIRVGGK